MTMHTLLDELKKRLRTICIADRTVIFLADQAALAHHESFRAFARSKSACNFLHETASAFDGASPLAIDITQLVDRQTDAFSFGVMLDRLRWACGISILVTPQPFSRAVASLRTQCDVMLPDDFNVVLRYFDTRVLPFLSEVLSRDQRAFFTAMASGWFYLDRDGHWCGIDIPADGVTIEAVVPLQLSASQQDALINAGESDAVLNQMRKMSCKALQTMTPPQQYPLVLPLIAKAQAIGVEATAMVALFCVIELSQPESTASRATWEAGLCEVRDGKKTFEVLLKDLSSV
jgi:hypothetical protein